MKNRTRTQGILENMSMSAGCAYLSDLHCFPVRYKTAIITTARRLTNCGYSIEEWTDAVHYITGRSGHFSSAEEAVLFLETFLKH